MSSDMFGWGIFLISVGIPVVIVIWFLRRFRGTTSSIKNGVPAGYVETLSLFERAEVGFNLYYTFFRRGSRRS